MNTFKQHPSPGATPAMASIESVKLALQQAIDKKLPKVIVKTSTFFVAWNEYLRKNWCESGYLTRDGSPVKNEKEWKELHELYSMIEVSLSIFNFKICNLPILG